MANVSKRKPIHLITIKYRYRCNAVCDNFFEVEPIEVTIKTHSYRSVAKGTFDPKKVTCKRCLKHPNYKTALDRIKYPLFFLKENA